MVDNKSNCCTDYLTQNYCSTNIGLYSKSIVPMVEYFTEISLVTVTDSHSNF